jgi:hypothetical protein
MLAALYLTDDEEGKRCAQGDNYSKERKLLKAFYDDGVDYFRAHFKFKCQRKRSAQVEHDVSVILSILYWQYDIYDPDGGGDDDEDCDKLKRVRRNLGDKM